jgi:hypothetical protein
MSGAQDKPSSPALVEMLERPRLYLQGVTWGYDVIRALDDDDPKALMASLRRTGADPNAVVDKDGYGGHKWSVWSHRMAGDTVLHLAVRWRKTIALAGLYPFAMCRPLGGSWLEEPNPAVFDLSITDQEGRTASEACEEEHGVPLPQFWRDAKAADEQLAADTVQREQKQFEANRRTAYHKLKAAHARAAEDYRQVVRCIGAEAEAETILEERRIIMPLSHEARQSGGFGKDVDLESRTESKRNLWLASGMKPKHGEVKVRGRPGGKADQFPVDLDEVENEALRDALRRMRDGVYPVDRLRAQYELRYGGAIGPSGGLHLGLCLPAVNTLTHIALPNMRVGVEGARAIARGLRHSRSIIYVDLRTNCILDAGACAFAKMLRSNDALRTLCLDANRIGDAAAVKVAAALMENYTLSKLSLTHNELTAEVGLKALGDAMACRVGRGLVIYPRPQTAVKPGTQNPKHHPQNQNRHTPPHHN